MKDDLENQREHRMKFWDKCKNLPGALDQFAVQVSLIPPFLVFTWSICLTIFYYMEDIVLDTLYFASVIHSDGSSDLTRSQFFK